MCPSAVVTFCRGRATCARHNVAGTMCPRFARAKSINIEWTRQWNAARLDSSSSLYGPSVVLAGPMLKSIWGDLDRFVWHILPGFTLLRPRQNEDTLCPAMLPAGVAKRGNIVARVAKRVNIWETWSRQQCCRHNVSSFCPGPNSVRIAARDLGLDCLTWVCAHRPRWGRRRRSRRSLPVRRPTRAEAARRSDRAVTKRVINFKFLLQPHQNNYITVWRTWLFIACSDERWSYCQINFNDNFNDGTMDKWTDE